MVAVGLLRRHGARHSWSNVVLEKTRISLEPPVKSPLHNAHDYQANPQISIVGVLLFELGVGLNWACECGCGVDSEELSRVQPPIDEDELPVTSDEASREERRAGHCRVLPSPKRNLMRNISYATVSQSCRLMWWRTGRGRSRCRSRRCRPFPQHARQAEDAAFDEA